MNGINLNNLPVNTQVKIVDKWRKDNEDGLQNHYGEMDKFLGGIFSIIGKPTSDRFYLDTEDTEPREWTWSIELIDKIKLPDSDTWYKVEYLEHIGAYIVGIEPEYYKSKKPEEVTSVKEPESKYMVYVSGKASPKKVHSTYESACKEAQRLAGKEVGYVVSVVKVERQFIGKVIVEGIE